MLLKQAAAGSNRWRQPPADAGKYERYCYTRKEKNRILSVRKSLSNTSIAAKDK
jgi:hypothetical protein